MIIQIPNSFIPERQYIIDVLFREFLGLEYNLEVVDGLTNYRILAGLKSITICDAFFSRVKGDQYLDECYLPCAAVFASGPLIPGEDLPVIYGDTLLAIGDDHITCGIDIFASSFFMLTRWEEYVIDERAVDNLFPENRTYAVKNNLQMRPIVNEYVEFLWNMLVSKRFTHNRSVFTLGQGIAESVIL